MSISFVAGITMLKQLVAFLLFASGAACSNGHMIEHDAPMLTQSQLYEPAQVASWLKENAGKADKTRATQFFDSAVKQKAQHRWGPAGKSFAESALHYPTPRALNEYAEIMLLFLGQERRRDGDLPAHAISDLRFSELLYRSSIAADSVLHTMSADERQRTRENADCLAAYLRDRTGLATCRPLHRYGLSPK
jgi:hypothetical protein